MSIKYLQAWEDLIAPTEVTYEDVVGIKAPAAPVHPRPEKILRTREEEPSMQKESHLEHLSTWIPSSQNRQVNSSKELRIIEKPIM